MMVPMRMGRQLLMVAALLVGGCATTTNEAIPTGEAAYQLIPAPAPGNVPREYLIGPLDTISITVFRDVRANMLGVVLNKFDAKAIGYSNNYSYSYTYKYGSAS